MIPDLKKNYLMVMLQLKKINVNKITKTDIFTIEENVVEKICLK